MMSLKRAIKRNTFLKCVICGKEFLNRFYDCDIKKGNGVVCSRICQDKLYSIKRPGITTTCIVCGKKVKRSPSQAHLKHCSRKCAGLEKMERKMSIDGYWVIHKEGYYKNEVKEHRWIMEQKIGRRLSPNEIVHHLNFDKLDNRIENLMIVTRGEHNTIHGFGKLMRSHKF